MNLRQVRTKIKSVSNVKKITKAMQMVSAVKMRKSQAAALEGRVYNEYLDTMIRRIAGSISKETSQLLQEYKSSERKLIVLVSSNKGLAGSFHSHLDRQILQTISPETDYITIGKKASQSIARMGGKIVAEFSEGSAVARVSAVFDLVLASFLGGSYQSVSLVYNKFISTSTYETKNDVLLPLTLPSVSETISEMPDKFTSNVEYLIEPDPLRIIDPLLRSYVEAQIREAILSSEASEHSSRMLAMKNATDNATDVIYSLQLLGNKLRQGKITSELLDMITAKESVEHI